MQPKEAIYFTFNKFFYDFLEDIKQVNDDLHKIIKEYYKVKNLQSTKNLEVFASHLGDGIVPCLMTLNVTDTMSLPSELDSLEVAKGITFKVLFDSLDSNTYSTVFCYIYHLVLMKVLFDFSKTEEDESNVHALFNQVMQVLRNIQNKEDYSESMESIYDDDIKALLQQIEKTAGNTATEIKEEDVAEASKDADEIISELENTTIGNMAKELTEELGLKDKKIESPDDMLKFITDGNALGNIIGKVSGKIQQKIASGQMKHEDLMKEAMSMMGVLNQGGFMNNPIMQQLSKAGNMRIDPNKIKTMGTKERLKRKLDERKK